ncbi:uncharacterized protein LOC135926784 [Gordionus sp. m RMFG-2023]|uniref:uncharacterized protein LOC135926784 n=1 Tax=Gordionus sp. m RMFG-2023 TaxID=3053472 RepID=UPI0031FBD101
MEISLAIKEVIDLYQLEENILACTADNANNILKSMDILQNIYKEQKFKGFRCCAHILNLISQEGLSYITTILEKCRDIAFSINKSNQAYVQICENKGITKFKIPSDIPIRWNENMDAIEEVLFLNYKQFKGVFFTVCEKEDLKEAVDFLRPFYKTTLDLSGSKYPTDNNNTRKEILNNMLDKMQKYLKELFCYESYVSTLLDPRLKQVYMPNTLNRIEYMTKFSKYLRKIENKKNTGITDSQEEINQFSFLERILSQKRNSEGDYISAEIIEKNISELHTYLNEPLVSLKDDILVWWKANSERFPVFSLAARNFLAIQATSVLCEQIFSKAGDLVTKKRNRLSNKTIQALMCMGSWLKNGMDLPPPLSPSSNSFQGKIMVKPNLQVRKHFQEVRDGKSVKAVCSSNEELGEISENDYQIDLLLKKI